MLYISDSLEVRVSIFDIFFLIYCIENAKNIEEQKNEKKDYEKNKIVPTMIF